MARCPFATWLPISGSCGPHVGGPFKIVHHTTESSSARGALSAFAQNKSDPHFTVDATTIFQHVDTSEGARSLRNDPGGVQTNRDSAVQIELVGFAHLPKDRRALVNVARLCRWLEETHGVPRVWPAGPPRPARNGRDPGGHNRNALIWDTQSGHFGHCHVPENTHWDPAYSAAEADFLMAAAFDVDGRLVSPQLPPAPASATGPALAPVRKSTMPDHGVVPLGIAAYVRDLTLLQSQPLGEAVQLAATKRAAKTARRSSRVTARSVTNSANVDVGSLLSFVAGVTEQDKSDVLYSVQLAQRAASGVYDRFTQPQFWYLKYVEVLQNLGWINEPFAFARFGQGEGQFRLDEAALGIVAAVATESQLNALRESVAAFSKLKKDVAAVSLFDFHACAQAGGNFQLGAITRLPQGALSMAMGAFHFHCIDDRRRFLFVRQDARQIHVWTAAQHMTLSLDFYAKRRAGVIAKLEADVANYIADLD